jgi:signal transduction histidine kinase/DNA-binding response OmpR family regulator/HPt (histidine-containing phosphotransfer) domain-containing protein
VKLRLTDKYFQRLGHHYILVMMILTRICGLTGGLLVVFYSVLTLHMPDRIYNHFCISAFIVCAESSALTVLIALWELRYVRRVLCQIEQGKIPDPEVATRAGRDAVTFAARHHRLEAWFVPCSTLVPVLLLLGYWDHASPTVMINITLSVFMGTAMALMSHFFAVEHCMRPVIRHLLANGVSINYQALPQGSLRFRLGFCSLLIVTTTALMIGTLARQRAGDIIDGQQDLVSDKQRAAVEELRTHSIYITVAAVITGVAYMSIMAGSVTKRMNVLLSAMEHVGRGFLSERVIATGNDEVDILARQFNSMVERLDHDNRTIRDLNQNLEGRVRDRTKQLEKLVAELSETQRQLTENNRHLDAARVEAEAANRAKSEFLANISHELRTPLNGVIGMTDLLLVTPLNTQQRKYVQTTKFSGKTLLELLNEVLDFSKIEAGRLEIEQIPFDLHEMIEPVIELMATRCREKSLEMAYFVDPSLPLRLVGDPGRLRQIVTNLLNNAIKFTERGSVVVRVLRAEDGDQVSFVKIAVEDSGIGIPESRFNRLFHAFSQVDASTTRKYGGTGLGLVICKKLCELMGGQIGFESRVGQGSNFWFTIPMHVPEATAQAPTPAGEQRSSIPKGLLGLPILIVDECEVGRTIAKDQLCGWGFDAQAVASGRVALRRLRESAAERKPYSIVLWESGISDVTKAELTAAVKSTSGLEKTTLVLLTPLGVVQDLQHLRKVGFAECVTKPIMQSALLDALSFLVEGDSAEKPRQRLGRKDVPQVDGIPRTNHKGARLLVAEDNEINQQVALEVLAHAGYQCDAVGDGRQAFEAIKKTRYDLVLMDCQMPEMDGFAATRLIRERERIMVQDAPPLPIIALTANAFKGEQEKCLAAGMTDYLSKPFDPAKLVCTIEFYLDQAANSGTAPEPVPALATAFVPQRATQVPPQEVVTPVVKESVKADEPEGVEQRREQPAIAQGSDGPSTVVDFESLLKRCLGNKELPKKLLTKFHARLPEELRQINAAVAARDSAQISALAHRLKGAAANLSAEPMREAAGELEAIGRSGDLTDAETWLARLNTEGTRFLRDVLQLAADKTALWQKTETSSAMSFGEIQCVS